MLKLLIPIIIVPTLIGAGFYLYKNLQTKQVNQTSPSPQSISTPSRSTKNPTASPVTKSDPCEVLVRGSSDVPALYPNVVSGKGSIITQKILGYDDEDNSVETNVTGCLINLKAVDQGTVGGITKYYYSGMNKLEWKEILSTDSPDGSLVSYKKDDRYFSIDVHIDTTISSGNNIKYNVKLFYSE